MRLRAKLHVMGEGRIEIDLTVKGSNEARTKKWKSGYDRNRAVCHDTMEDYIWASKHPSQEMYVCNACSLEKADYVLLQPRCALGLHSIVNIYLFTVSISL